MSSRRNLVASLSQSPVYNGFVTPLALTFRDPLRSLCSNKTYLRPYCQIALAKSPNRRIVNACSTANAATGSVEKELSNVTDPTEALLENIQILKVTEQWVAINKPAGVLVHRTRLYPSRRGERFLVDAVRSKLSPKLGRRVDVYPVHRLDRPTTGVILFGLHEPRNAAMLQEALQADNTQKQYWVLAFGADMPEHWTNDHPLKDLKGQNRKQRPAQSDFQRLAGFDDSDIAVVRATISTGRRHQIRRHLSNSKYPVVGDSSHGDTRRNHVTSEAYGISRLCLHARRLSFTDPFTSKSVYLQVPVPKDLRDALQRLPGYTSHLDKHLDLQDLDEISNP